MTRTKLEKKNIQLSAVIPVTERYDDLRELLLDYKRGISATGLTYEFVVVLDGYYPQLLDELKKLKAEGEHITIIVLAKWFGEATALTIGFKHAAGEIILTLPAYHQIRTDEIPRLIDALEGSDMVLARRWPRIDSFLNRLQSKVFNYLLRSVSSLSVHDAGCGVRAIRRHVTEEVYIYGDLHRFLPIMAHRHGFTVTELKVAQAEQDRHQRLYPPGIYLRRLLDLLTVFFLIRFTYKPLRFFGLLGTAVFFLGALGIAYLVADRLIWDAMLGNRPALFLSSLLVVLGIQLLAIGLIGELIIFTHARDMKEYNIAEIVN